MKSKCRFCTQPATSSGYCEFHNREYRPPSPSNRKRTPRTRQYPLRSDKRWAKLSRTFLRANPFCVRCLSRPLQSGGPLKTPSTQADHVLPVRSHPDLKYSYDNLQPLCTSCHSIKTAHESRGVIYDYRESSK